MKRLIIFGLFLGSLSVFGTEAYFTMENDTFLSNADNDYTHGTGFELVTDNRIHLKLQQNMYAPSDLRLNPPDKNDRPYCGLLLGGVGYEFFQDPESPWTHYGELNFGMIGPSTKAGETQKFIHKWLGCKEPKGWDYQLHDEFVVNGQWWTKYNYYFNDYVALVPRAGVLAGTIQDAAEIGCDLKVGWNIREHKDVGNNIMFSAPNKSAWYNKISCWIFGGVGERYYLYNHIIEGSLFNNKDDHLSDVDIEPFVTELRAGAVLKAYDFYLAYIAVFRTDEFKGQKNAPDYGCITFGYSF